MRENRGQRKPVFWHILRSVNNFVNRVTIAKIRSVSFKLAVVTGKWVPLEHQTFQIVVLLRDSELHLLFHYPKYSQLRELLLKHKWENKKIKPSSADVNFQLQYFFANSSVKIWNKVSKFINETRQIRETLIKRKQS